MINCNLSVSFTPLLSEYVNILKPIIQINVHKLSITALKYLDSFLSISEERLIKSQSNDFLKGWLYDSIILLFKISQIRNDVSYVNSSLTFLYILWYFKR